MFHFLKDFVFFSRKKNRKAVYLFGASVRGQCFYKKYGKHYEVKGYIDNNTSLYGKEVCGLEVFKPDVLKFVNDSIIITSEYSEDIYKQLRTTLDVSDARITLDREEKMKIANFEAVFRRYISNLIILFEPSKYLLSCLMWFSKHRGVNATPHEIRNILWLDQVLPIFQLRPAYTAEHVGPSWLVSNIQSANLQVAAVDVYQFENAIFHAAGRYLLTYDRNIIIERVSGYNGLGSYRSGILKEHGYHKSFVQIVDEKEKLPIGILINCFAPTNYYHWMIEALPQLELISEKTLLAGLPLFISKSVLKYPAMQKTLDLALRGERDIIYLDDKKSYTAEKVYFISSPNNVVPNLLFGERCRVDCSFFRAESLRYVRDLALRAMEQYEQARLVKKRIFIGRKGVLRRYNQEEVLKILQPFGFELVFMEDYAFETQVQLFSTADYVVGPTGAAWVGLLYMRPKSKALCWMASETGEFSCYSELAHFSEVELSYIKFDTGAKSMADLYFLGYHIDTSQVKQWLTKQGFYNEQLH